MDFSKLKGHIRNGTPYLPVKIGQDIAGCPNPASRKTEDWLRMFKTFDIHVDLYCASSGMERWEALESLNDKLEKCAASFPDLLTCVERERERNERRPLTSAPALTQWRYDRRNARRDRRASQ